jgi:hypothetical protein
MAEPDTILIEATSGTYRSRVDGTIVLSVEIEPSHRAAALQLFGMPGTPLAIAALRVGHAAKSDAANDSPKGKVGPRCLRAVMLCQEPEFWRWITFASMSGAAPENDREASAIVKRVCGITSRRELDTDETAWDCFVKKFEAPYVQWLGRKA